MPLSPGLRKTFRPRVCDVLRLRRTANRDKNRDRTGTKTGTEKPALEMPSGRAFPPGRSYVTPAEKKRARGPGKARRREGRNLRRRHRLLEHLLGHCGEPLPTGGLDAGHAKRCKGGNSRSNTMQLRADSQVISPIRPASVRPHFRQHHSRPALGPYLDLRGPLHKGRQSPESDSPPKSPRRRSSSSSATSASPRSRSTTRRKNRRRYRRESFSRIASMDRFSTCRR